MACPFSARRPDSLPRQGSITADPNPASTWNIEDDLAEIPDDALALTHLQLAIQLLTAPSVILIYIGNSFVLYQILVKPYKCFIFYLTE